jgi:hypothetical protein
LELAVAGLELVSDALVNDGRNAAVLVGSGSVQQLARLRVQAHQEGFEFGCRCFHALSVYHPDMLAGRRSATFL